MCEICDGVGFYRTEQTLEGGTQHYRLVRCECKATADAERLQRLSGLTPSERLITLEQIDTLDRPGTLKMVQHCQRFMKRPSHMLTFWGGPGNAKTMALQAVVNHFIESHDEAVYVTAFDLISFIRSAFTKTNNNDLQVNDDSAYARLLRFAGVRILAIDEFDKVRVTDWVQEQLTDLIDRRYRLALDGQAGTMIAMNSNPRTLPEWMYSRLAQHSIIHNDDADLRPVMGALQMPMLTYQPTGEILE